MRNGEDVLPGEERCGALSVLDLLLHHGPQPRP
jgi:hypothetical protein